MLIDPDARTVEAFRRADAGLWLLKAYAPGETISFESLGLELDPERLFEGA